MTKKIMIPKSRIPKFKAVCVRCESPRVHTKTSSPFTEGYHRGHLCLDCNARFYTLAPYDGSPPKIKDGPFRDTPMSPYEQERRWHEWKAAQQEQAATFEVSLIQRIEIALRKPVEKRDTVEKYLAKAHDVLMQKVRELEDAA